MPLFTFQCINKECENKQERFIKAENIGEAVLCKNCGSKCNKLVGAFKSKTNLRSRDLFAEKIDPDVERIRNDISNGKDSTFLDIYGEK